ncbi:hypothetical protein [Oceanobacillus manasiensis]|uniref:hypothetical protein n=1 Tax=Oceanobacillus manasiensis TaxID=586413 RepID=UPI0005A67647|nr:hypothetical protein [Oceanobacillus manasiensis]
MEIAVFFFLSWLAISLFTAINKDLSIVTNTFIFLIILIVSINFSWIINDELNLITLREEWTPYTAYLLNRSILIPILVLLQVNLFIKTHSYIKKGIILVSSIIILLMISFISTQLNIIEFKEWSLWLEAIYLICLNLIGLISYTLFNKIKGVQESK